MRRFLLPALALALLLPAGSAFAATSDLSITNPSVDPGDTVVGRTVSYTMQVQTGGPDAVDAIVSDQLGDAETLLSASTSQGSCTQEAPVTCSLGTLAFGQSVTVTITVKYTKTGYNEHSDAVSSPGTDDPDPNNNRGGAGFQVTAPEAAFV